MLPPTPVSAESVQPATGFARWCQVDTDDSQTFAHALSNLSEIVLWDFNLRFYPDLHVDQLIPSIFGPFQAVNSNS